uniref:GLI pathosis related 1 n=1 Tax=Chrysemys picta bellii TaxID=8478 RepID=A0A8C3HY61_CHRPI|nr:glioma pathogenesis-related protein 1-like [Chrysemys picta bellii]XP_042716044.1 glioma pathogenesis-related protein 1-like [Chrysemys picta bellii]
MKVRLFLGVLLLLDLLSSCYSYKSNTLPDIEDRQFIKECVNAHNSFRSKVNPPASNMRHMSWDSALAKSAKAWAKRCHFDHNGYLKISGKMHPNFTPVGENIWTGSLRLFSASAAISNWYNEVTDYTFETRYCTRMCGHYTQVVWARSYKVGCAVQFCPRVTGFDRLTNGAHFVCNYAPAGNFPTQPYKTGAACSDCSGEKCVDKLCENPERDTLKSYSSWYPDWDIPPHANPSGAPHPNPSGAPHPSPPRSSCDQYCITVLIVRLLFVLLTFGAVLLVQWQYPQIFIYE